MAAVDGRVRRDVAFVVPTGLGLPEARDEGVDVPGGEIRCLVGDDVTRVAGRATPREVPIEDLRRGIDADYEEDVLGSIANWLNAVRS